MISSTLLTMAIFIATGSPDPVTADEIRYIDSHLVQLDARVEDQIGNSIQLAGFSRRVTISPNLKIPRRGTKERSPLLKLNLLQQSNGWVIIDARISPSLKKVMQRHSLRLNQYSSDRRNSICRFLLRESSFTSRGSLWRSLRTEWNDEPIRWITLGGEFLSAEKVLTEEIGKWNLQPLATRAGLYLYQDKWISQSDYYQIYGLTVVNGKVIDLVRSQLKELAEQDMDRLLNQSRKNNVPGEIQAGTSRKMVRFLWGDPEQVTWVRWQNHMIEQWHYSTQLVRIIDGNVCEISSTEKEPSS